VQLDIEVPIQELADLLSLVCRPYGRWMRERLAQRKAGRCASLPATGEESSIARLLRSVSAPFCGAPVAQLRRAGGVGHQQQRAGTVMAAWRCPADCRYLRLLRRFKDPAARADARGISARAFSRSCGLMISRAKSRDGRYILVGSERVKLLEQRDSRFERFVIQCSLVHKPIILPIRLFSAAQSLPHVLRTSKHQCYGMRARIEPHHPEPARNFADSGQL